MQELGSDSLDGERRDISQILNENDALKLEVEQLKKVVDEFTSKREEQLSLSKQLQMDHTNQFNILQEQLRKREAELKNEKEKFETEKNNLENEKVMFGHKKLNKLESVDEKSTKDFEQKIEELESKIEKKREKMKDIKDELSFLKNQLTNKEELLNVQKKKFRK